MAPMQASCRSSLDPDDKPRTIGKFPSPLKAALAKGRNKKVLSASLDVGASVWQERLREQQKTRSRGLRMLKLSGRAFCYLAAAFVMLATVSPSSGQAQTRAGARTLAADCAGDLRTFCSPVSPGNDRLVACLIAYEDKISPRCRLTAYLASGGLGNRMKYLQGMARTCSSDILQYCSKVPAGGGRIYGCLKSNRATLTNSCRKGLPTFERLLR
jgi:hypothetical protein